MSTLIISYLIHPPTGTPHGQRVWSDGRAEGYQVTRIVKQADGTFKYQPITPDFYPLAMLSPLQISAIQHEALALNPIIAGNHAALSDPLALTKGRLIWEMGVNAAGETERGEIIPWPPAADAPSFAMMEFINRIGAIILAAQAGKTEIPA